MSLNRPQVLHAPERKLGSISTRKCMTELNFAVCV